VVKEEIIGLVAVTVLAEVAVIGVKNYCYFKCWGQLKANLSRKAYLVHYFFHLQAHSFKLLVYVPNPGYTFYIHSDRT
jgi:hypothetical protein